MGDMGDIFRAMKEESKERRASHREHAPELLKAADIAFTEHNNGAHLVVIERFDFWPGTGKWIDRTTKGKGRGVHNLIRRVQQLSSGSPQR